MYVYRLQRIPSDLPVQSVYSNHTASGGADEAAAVHAAGGGAASIGASAPSGASVTTARSSCARASRGEGQSTIDAVGCIGRGAERRGVAQAHLREKLVEGDAHRSCGHCVAAGRHIGAAEEGRLDGGAHSELRARRGDDLGPPPPPSHPPSPGDAPVSHRDAEQRAVALDGE